VAALEGKTAIVTGGSSGIGAAVTRALAREDARVAAGARRVEHIPDEAAAFELDVADASSSERFVAAALDELGGLDILVNNAGLSWGAPTLEYPLDKWQLQLQVNLTGVWLMAQAAAPHMIERGGGKIVNISSVLGQLGIAPEIQESVAYNVSKGGVNALTRDLAVNWACHNINVNAVAPGYFPSRMTQYLVNTVECRLQSLSPMHRLGRPDELKGAVVFRCSPAANFVSRQVLAVDCGITAW